MRAHNVCVVCWFLCTALLSFECAWCCILQGKIQGFGSAGPVEASSTYSGIGSSGSSHGGLRSSSSLGSGLPSSFAAAQQAASQITHAATQALGDGPIAQGIASAASALGGFLQPAGYGSRLNVSV